jgi:hypothetical protein
VGALENGGQERAATKAGSKPMRTPGVEPGSQAWKACMIPLHYVRHAWAAARGNTHTHQTRTPTRTHAHAHTHTHTHTRTHPHCRPRSIADTHGKEQTQPPHAQQTRGRPRTRAENKKRAEEHDIKITRRLCFNLRLQHLRILLLHR